MSFELFVALRYLRSKRKGLFSLVTTVIGVAGVSIGVAALIVILSVMNGFQADIRKKIVGAQAHVTVHAKMTDAKKKVLSKILEGTPEITATAPFVLGQAILSYEDRSTGVVLKGIEPEREFEVNDLAKTLRAGSWEGILKKHPRKPPGAGKGAGYRSPVGIPGVVLGEELSRNVGVWLGEEIILISPQGLSTPMGMMPTMKRFKVVGLLRTGYYEYDSAMAYTSREAAAAFLKVPGDMTGMQIRLADITQSEDTASLLRTKLGFDFTVRSFTEMNRTLFAALKLEKCVMFIIVTLIVLVASFNIASNLILMGTEKLRDVGLLRAMGATRAEMLRIFLWVGALIGSFGVISGSLFGLGICAFLHRYPIIELPGDIYYLSRLPVQVNAPDVLLIVGCGLALSILAALYPAYRASQVDPIEAIHYG